MDSKKFDALTKNLSRRSVTKMSIGAAVLGALGFGIKSEVTSASVPGDPCGPGTDPGFCSSNQICQCDNPDCTSSTCVCNFAHVACCQNEDCPQPNRELCQAGQCKCRQAYKRCASGPNAGLCILLGNPC